MDKTGSRSSKVWGTILAGLAPVVILSICLFFRKMLPGQDKILVYGDYLTEYLPFFKYFWHALLHGKSLEYSFSLGMGSPTMAMYSVFVFSPFSFIAYVIEDTQLAGYVTLILKIALSSSAIYYFLIADLKCRRGTAYVFSLFYSLSAYMTIYYINIHFLDIFYILPILIHFLIKFVKEGKTLGLTILYAFSFINNFFDGYCTGFFSFIIYIMLLWYLDVRGERLIKSIKAYVGVVFIAALLSGPVVLPAIMYVMQHMPGGSDFSVIPLRSPLYVINSLLFGRKIRSIFDSMPAVYCGWPAVLLTLMFFFGKNDKKKKIFALVPILFLLICILWHPAYLFMHLFNEPDSFPWRFSFLWVFMLVCTAAYEYDHTERKLLSFSYIVPSLIMLILLGTAYFFNKNELVNSDLIPGYIFGINIAFFLICLIVINKKFLLYLFCIAEVFCAVYLQLPQNDFHTAVQADVKEDMDRMYPLQAAIYNDATPFFRSSVFSSFILNTSLLYDYPGIDYFCSFDNYNLINAMKMLGLQGRPQQYSNCGNTEFTNMILSVKYIGATVKQDIYENSPVLPLAFSVNKDVKEIEITENPFENQQSLADAMTLEDRKMYTPIAVEMNTNEGLEMDIDYDNKEYTFTKTGDEGRAAWFIADEPDDPAYMYISTGTYGTGIADKDNILAGAPVSVETPLSLPIIYEFFVKEEGSSPAIYLSMTGNIGSEVTIKKTIPRKLDKEAVMGIYDELAPLGLKIESFDDVRIKGKVTADEGHTVLFSSIPYDINWRIKIDGKEVETYAVFNGAFLACDITAGTHEVEYIYKDSSVVIGLGAFAVGLLLLLLQMNKKRDDSVMTEPAEEENNAEDIAETVIANDEEQEIEEKEGQE